MITSPRLEITWNGWKPKVYSFKEHNDIGPVRIIMGRWMIFNFSIRIQRKWGSR